MQNPGGCTFPVILGALFAGLLSLVLIPVGVEEGVGPSPAEPQEPVSVVESSSDLGTQVDEAEARWQTQGIDSYTLEVMTASIWHLQYHTITVEAGEVVDSSARCDPAPTEIDECTVQEFDAEDFTVPGLLAKARAAAEIEQGQWSRLEFDATYGYPSMISYNHPEIYDEEWWWSVESFEILAE